MPQVPIPDDWNGIDWACILVEWPDSVQWMGILRGFVTEPTRGRFWSASSGSIKAAQAIGRLIEERNEVMSCTEISNQLAIIATLIGQLNIQQEVQANSSVELNVVTSSAALASANAYAWSVAFAEATSSVIFRNNVNVQIRNLQPGVILPPTATEEAETGITSTPAAMQDDEICKRVFWLIYQAQQFALYMRDRAKDIDGGVLSVAGLIADALQALSHLAPSGATEYFLWPASVVLQMAHAIAQMAIGGSLANVLDEVYDAIGSSFQTLVCLVYEDVLANETTETIRATINGILTNYTGFTGVAAWYMMGWFHLGNLALLYYTSPLVPTYEDIIPPYNPFICSACE